MQRVPTRCLENWALGKHLINKSLEHWNCWLWELRELMPLAWTWLVVLGTINLARKGVLKGLYRKRTRGIWKEKGKPCHIGTRGASLFRVPMRYLGTQRIPGGGWERGEWRGELICMYQRLQERAGNVFHKY